MRSCAQASPGRLCNNSTMRFLARGQSSMANLQRHRQHHHRDHNHRREQQQGEQQLGPMMTRLNQTEQTHSVSALTVFALRSCSFQKSSPELLWCGVSPCSMSSRGMA